MVTCELFDFFFFPVLLLKLKLGLFRDVCYKSLRKQPLGIKIELSSTSASYPTGWRTEACFSFGSGSRYLFSVRWHDVNEWSNTQIGWDYMRQSKNKIFLERKDELWSRARGRKITETSSPREFKVTLRSLYNSRCGDPLENRQLWGYSKGSLRLMYVDQYRCAYQYRSEATPSTNRNGLGDKKAINPWFSQELSTVLVLKSHYNLLTTTDLFFLPFLAELLPSCLAIELHHIDFRDKACPLEHKKKRIGQEVLTPVHTLLEPPAYQAIRMSDGSYARSTEVSLTFRVFW